MLRKIFGPKKDKVIKEERRLHNEELYGLYCSPDIIRVNNSRRMVGGACGTCGDEEAYTECWWGNLR